jgi:glycosyltransferase involved in cell wall biosynthesis
MKISFLILDAYVIEGTPRTIITLANELATRHDVEIISVLRRADRPHFRVDKRVRLRGLVDLRPDAPVRWPVAGARRRMLEQPSRLIHPEDRAYDYFSRWTDLQLRRALRRLDSDVLITTRAGLNLVAARYAPRRVITIGQEHLNYRVHEPGIFAEIKKWYPKLSVVATLTDEDNRDYAQLLHGSGTKAVTIGNGLPPMAYPRSSQENRIVATAGRLHPQKGYDLLIPAFAKVVEKRPDWKLRIYGRGSEYARLRSMIVELGLSNHVLLMGATDDIEGELAKSSLLVVSSRFEGFGMTIIEAFACGVPVVSFDCPRGPGEIITHGRDGLLVPAENGALLTDALLELIEDTERRRNFAAEALRSAERHSIGVVAQRWEELFTELRAAR